jgi:hypothetical protein
MGILASGVTGPTAPVSVVLVNLSGEIFNDLILLISCTNNG